MEFDTLSRWMLCSVTALVNLAIAVAVSAEESGSRSQSSEQPAVNGAPMIAMDRAPKLIFNPSTVEGYRCESRTCSGVASMAITPGARLWVAWYTGTTPGAKIETCPNAYVVVSTIHSADIALFQKHLKRELDEARRAVGCAATITPEKSSINL